MKKMNFIKSLNQNDNNYVDPSSGNVYEKKITVYK